MNLQKIINFTALLAAITALYLIASTIHTSNQQTDIQLALVNLIARGEALGEDNVADLKILLNDSQKQDYQHSLMCFIKAYNKVVMQGGIVSEGLFKLFQENSYEYDNVDSCSHYYSVLIHRAQVMESSQKQKILPILNQLQLQYQNSLFPVQKQKHICVLVNVFNSESTVKNMVKQLVAQQYQNVNIFMQDDGSTDNTMIFAKYTLEDLLKIRSDYKFGFDHRSERKGWLSNFNQFLEKNCQKQSIVMIMQNSQVLIGQNGLKLVNEIFEDSHINIAVFDSLTIKHMNVERGAIADQDGTVSIKVAPIIAFRRNIYEHLNRQFSQRVQLGQSQNIQRQFLLYHLLKTQGKLRSFKETNKILASCLQHKNETITKKVQELSQLYLS